jgi:DNA-binding protein H-NS
MSFVLLKNDMTTYRQLKQQIAGLEKKAAIAMKEAATKAIEAIKKRGIAGFGLTAAHLGLELFRRAGAKARKGRKLALLPKYREPATGKTWNGHGSLAASQGIHETHGQEDAEETHSGARSSGDEARGGKSGPAYQEASDSREAGLAGDDRNHGAHLLIQRVRRLKPGRRSGLVGQASTPPRSFHEGDRQRVAHIRMRSRRRDASLCASDHILAAPQERDC